MERLASLVRQAGFPEAEVPRMVAVAMAESGGNPRAHNPNAATGDNSYGLLQVNMLGQMGDERRKAFGLKSNEDLFDPLTNLKAARRIYESQGIGAWGAWTNGSASKYLEAARKAAGSPAAAASAFDGSGLGGSALSGSSSAASAALASYQQQEGSGLDLQPLRRPQTAGDAAGAALAAAGGLRFAGSGALGQAAAAVMSRPTRLPQLGDLSGLDDGGEAKAMATLLGGAAADAGGSSPGAGAGGGLSGESMSLVDLLKGVESAGLRVRENPAFGGVGKHSPNSYHYARDRHGNGLAADITDWNDGDWKGRTAKIGELARQVFGKQAEIFHPGYDPVGGHHSHLHFALPGGSVDRALGEKFLSLLPGIMGRRA